MPSFIVHIDVLDVAILPATVEDDLRALIAHEGGGDFKIHETSGAWPPIPISFVLDAETEGAAAKAGHEIIKSVTGGRISFAVPRIIPQA